MERGVAVMNLEELFEEILPYLSDPQTIREFLNLHKKSNREELIEAIDKQIAESDVSLKTDLRILLNAISKHPEG